MSACADHPCPSGGAQGRLIIALFGFESGAALATVVGVLIEVPVMLFAVGVVNRSRRWYERRPGVPTYAECCPVGDDLATHG